jgi:hypothetical protein
VAILWRHIVVDGTTHYIVSTSVEHPKVSPPLNSPKGIKKLTANRQVPEYKDKYVRAILSFSLIAFIPDGTSPWLSCNNLYISKLWK